MSRVTNRFEDRANVAKNFNAGAVVFSMVDVGRLLQHTRELEAMLKKHEWCDVNDSENDFCPECYGGRTYNGHASDCALAKLLE